MKIKKKSKIKKYPNGGEISLDEFRPKFQSDKTKINKIIVDPNKGFQNPIPKNKQEWYNKSSGRVEESISPLDFIPLGTANTSFKLFNNFYNKVYKPYNTASDYFNMYETANNIYNLNNGGNIQTYAMGGINRYDVPAQMPTGQQFFQLPYNELAMALASKQKAYDEQEAEMAKNQAFLADLKSGYRTAGLPQEIQKEYNDKFQSYVGQDLTKPEIKRAFVGDIARLKSDPRLRTLAADIKQSALWDAYQQAHPDLAGAAVNPYKQGEQWTPAKNEDGTWQSEDQVNNWYGNITPFADFNKPIDDAYSKVKANVVQTLTDSGIQVQHDEATGKDFFYKDITKKDKQYIDETLPQWQAAATEQSINFQSSSTPEARYFQARFAKEIAQDPDFIKKYISTAGGKYVYNQVKTEDVSKQVGTSSGSGSGSSKEVKTASPFQITQITKTNPNLQGYKLPEESIKEIDNSINQYISTEGKGLNVITNDKGQKEFAIPANATIDQINEIQAKNAQLAETQQAKQNLIDINNIVASKNGFKPNTKGEYDIISQLPLNLQKEVKEAYNTAIRQRDYYNNQTQGSSMTGASVISTPPPNPDAVVKNIASKDPRFKKYLEELEAISKGIKLTGGNAYPLVGEEFKDVNAGIMNVLTQKTNYFDGSKGGIEYLQNNDRISDDDKEYVSKLIAEKGLSELNGRTSIFWDQEKGEYSALAIFPRSKSDGGDLYLKISQNLLGGLPTEAMKLDPIYNESSRQLFRKSYEDHSQATNNIHGRIGGVIKDFETTHIMANDLDNKGNQLNTGDTVFTLPELPNIVVKVGTFDSMDNFMRDYEKNKPQGTALLELLKNNGMTPITSPGFYNRYKSRVLPASFAPKQ